MRIYPSKRKHLSPDPFLPDLYRGSALRIYLLIQYIHFFEIHHPTHHTSLKNKLLSEWNLVPYFKLMSNSETIEELKLIDLFASAHLEDLLYTQIYERYNESLQIINQFEKEFIIEYEPLIKKNDESFMSFAQYIGKEIAHEIIKEENIQPKQNISITYLPVLINRYFYGKRMDRNSMILRKINSSYAEFENLSSPTSRLIHVQKEHSSLFEKIERAVLRGIYSVLSPDSYYNRTLHNHLDSLVVVDQIHSGHEKQSI